MDIEILVNSVVIAEGTGFKCAFLDPLSVRVAHPPGLLLEPMEIKRQRGAGARKLILFISANCLYCIEIWVCSGGLFSPSGWGNSAIAARRPWIPALFSHQPIFSANRARL